MVAPSHFSGRGKSEAMPALSFPQRTCTSNTIAHLGFPDKPEPRYTNEQKRTDEEEVRHTKNAKQKALQDSHHQISALQEKMVDEQVVALTSDHIAVHPRPCPCVMQKVQGTNNPVIMLPCDPFPEPEKRAKEQDVHKLLIGISCERLRDAKASSTSSSSQPPATIQLYGVSCTINTEVERSGQAKFLIITDNNDSDELCFVSQHSKGHHNIQLQCEYAVANIKDVTDSMTEKSESDWPMAHRDKLQKGKRKWDIPSDTEETEKEGSKTPSHASQGSQRLMLKVSLARDQVLVEMLTLTKPNPQRMQGSTGLEWDTQMPTWSRGEETEIEDGYETEVSNLMETD
ncbi:hypothetical protein JVU11DRAFT_11767 [Chiua virens]|nr:hypothetical protein JVU11DRAFT_11767 [Chiua virens]